MKWEILTLTRKQGGLGMRNLSIQNNCLLQKWLWRFCTEDGALWRRFIAGKYGLFSQWTTEEVMGSFGCCVWKTIRRLWPQFNDNIYISVGNGLKTDFWNEIWKGDDSLRNLFPNLYTLSLQRSATVAQVWSQQGWNLVFRRALNDWEIEDVARLLEVLNTPPAISQRKDKPIWKLHSKGMFTVKSCYWRINVNQSVTKKWPWKLVWKTRSPLKVACFVWLVIRKACLTHEALQKRGMQFYSRCFMCEQKAEVNNHLFIHCKAASKLWNMFLCILGVSWVMPKTTMELLNSWTRTGNKGKSEDWWKTIPACIWWTLWKERNARCFEGQNDSFQKIEMKCLSLLFFWCKQELVGESIEMVDFKGNL